MQMQAKSCHVPQDVSRKINDILKSTPSFFKPMDCEMARQDVIDLNAHRKLSLDQARRFDRRQCIGQPRFPLPVD